MFKKSLILIFLFASVLYSQAVTGKSGNFELESTRTFDSAPGGRLKIDNIRADVKISSWQENHIRVVEYLKMSVRTREEADRIAQTAAQSYQVDGSTLCIAGEKGGGIDEHHLTINMPKKFNIDLSLYSGNIDVDSIEGTITLQTSAGDIDLKDLSGKIRVNSAGGDIELEALSGECTLHTAGGDIQLTDIFGETFAMTAGGDIELEGSTARVSLSTAGGDIQISRAQEAVSAKTQGGDIEISQCAGDLNLSTMGGDVKMEELSGKVNATSMGGEVKGSQFTGPIDVTTMGGSIKLDEVKGPVNAKTHAGTIDVRCTMADFSRPHRMTLETTVGDILLSLPKNLPATLSAEVRTHAPERWVKSHGIYSDFPLVTTKPEKWDQPIIRSSGDINGGGDTISLKTSAGDITIKAE